MCWACIWKASQNHTLTFCPIVSCQRKLADVSSSFNHHENYDNQFLVRKKKMNTLLSPQHALLGLTWLENSSRYMTTCVFFFPVSVHLMVYTSTAMHSECSWDSAEMVSYLSPCSLLPTKSKRDTWHAGKYLACQADTHTVRSPAKIISFRPYNLWFARSSDVVRGNYLGQSRQTRL